MIGVHGRVQNASWSVVTMAVVSGEWVRSSMDEETQGRRRVPYFPAFLLLADADADADVMTLLLCNWRAQGGGVKTWRAWSRAREGSST